jgi:pre-mRNA-splicing factor ATP-dependent RNA helicase DHX15/PRP43
VATNIAETSMVEKINFTLYIYILLQTIEGVVYVIDPGYCKRKEFDPKRRIESLLIRPITQASAIQRAGRAGRTRPGKCFRLYTESDFRGMKLIEPEIWHSNLANVLLRMKKSGVPDLYSFDYMDAPPSELLSQSIAMLTHLAALDSWWK